MEGCEGAHSCVCSLDVSPAEIFSRVTEVIEGDSNRNQDGKALKEVHCI